MFANVRVQALGVGAIGFRPEASDAHLLNRYEIPGFCGQSLLEALAAIGASLGVLGIGLELRDVVPVSLKRTAAQRRLLYDYRVSVGLGNLVHVLRGIVREAVPDGQDSDGFEGRIVRISGEYGRCVLVRAAGRADGGMDVSWWGLVCGGRFAALFNTKVPAGNATLSSSKAQVKTIARMYGSGKVDSHMEATMNLPRGVPGLLT